MTFLGITFDQRLDMGPHVSKLCKEIDVEVAAFRQEQQQNKSPKAARAKFYTKLMSKISYGGVAWFPYLFSRSNDENRVGASPLDAFTHSAAFNQLDRAQIHRR